MSAYPCACMPPAWSQVTLLAVVPRPTATAAPTSPGTRVDALDWLETVVSRAPGGHARLAAGGALMVWAKRRPRRRPQLFSAGQQGTAYGPGREVDGVHNPCCFVLPFENLLFQTGSLSFNASFQGTEKKRRRWPQILTQMGEKRCFYEGGTGTLRPFMHP